MFLTTQMAVAMQVYIPCREGGEYMYMYIIHYKCSTAAFNNYMFAWTILL